ncbi:MAG TPA: DUF1559 domain-containing protein [Pirellulaceae bacterium]|nr:DUF1559 domain-containing protein [Pirellulaceae bacterium]
MTIAANPHEPTAVKSVAKFHFRIRDLLIVTLLVALFFGGIFEQNLWLLGASLIGAFGCAILVWRVTLVKMLVAIAFTAILIPCLLPPSCSIPNWVARKMYCGNNLKIIGVALHTYHDVYHTLPPAYVADETGKPMHSWRVLLLPYMEQDALYRRYRFDEPWDGPNNRLLADEIAAVYQCPNERNSTKHETNYVAVVGPNTPWPGEKPATLKDFKDGMINVILIVEVHQSGIDCMEPRDLDLFSLVPRVNPAKGVGISSRHPWKKDMRRTSYGAHVLMADGSVIFLGPEAHVKTIESRLRINDGTIIDYTFD